MRRQLNISEIHNCSLRIAYALSLVFVYFNSIKVFSQSLPTKKYTTREGLVQMQVTSTLEDSRGYIWAGTKGGISKFDGENFENFIIADGLLGREIHHFFEDSKGRIWFKYPRYGVGYFDGKTFTNISRENVPNLSNITEYKGRILVVENNQLYEVQSDTFKLSHIKVPQLSTDEEVQMIFSKAGEKLHLITSHQVYIYETNSNRFQSIKTHSKNTVAGYSIQNGLLFYRTFRNDRIQWSKIEGTTITPFFEMYESKVTVLKPLDVDFIFSWNSKTYLLEKGSERTVKVSDFFGNFPTTTYSPINKGRIYFGTEKGLFVVYTNGFRYFTEKEVPYAWSVVEDKKGEMWFANYGYDLQKWDGKTLKTIKDYQVKSLKTFKSETGYSQDIGSLNNWYFNAQKDDDGKLWFPNFRSVLVKEGPNSKLLTSTGNDPFNIHPLFFNLTYDEKRKKILGSGMEGVAVVDMKKVEIDFIIKDTSEMFANERLILTTTVDHNGKYWMGARGVCLYDPAQKTFKYYNEANGKFKGIGVCTIVEDSRQNIWLGTFESGIYLLNKRKDVFERVFENVISGPSYYQGEVDSSHYIIGDRHNLFILDTDKYFDEGIESFTVFNHHNGFMGLEPNQEGFYKDSQNRVWVTSGTVLSYFELEKLKLNNDQLIPIIRRVNDEKLSLINTELSVSLPYKEDQVVLQMDALGLNKSFETLFSYKVNTLKNEWSKWYPGNQITINSLVNGENVISVRSKRGLEIDEAFNTASVTITVNKPFYMSASFYKYVALGGLVFTLGIGLLFFRNRQQGKELEAQLIKIKDNEKKVRLLQVQTAQAQMNPHFTFNVLGSIQNMILSKQTDKANLNLVKLSDLIRNYLEASVMYEEMGDEITPLEIPLYKELELLEMYIGFEVLQAKERFTFNIKVDPIIDIHSYQIPPLLIQPFVENAIKHGLLYKESKGHLQVNFREVSEDILEIKVMDDGIGIDESQKISEKSIRAYKSRGLGLILKRIDVLNELSYDIKVTVKSSSQNGTEVTILIDYENQE